MPAHLMARRLVVARPHCPQAAARRPGEDPVSPSLVPALGRLGLAGDLAGPVTPGGVLGPALEDLAVVAGRAVVAGEVRNSSRWTPLPTPPTTQRCPRGKW